MRKWFFWMLALATLFHISSPDLAQACSCIADPYSKKYLLYKKTWYGTKRKWTCVYTCQDSKQQRTEVLGTHEDWYTTDKGLEGVCEGLHYVQEFNGFKMDYIWMYKEARWFTPSQSTAPELKSWYRKSCK